MPQFSLKRGHKTNLSACRSLRNSMPAKFLFLGAQIERERGKSCECRTAAASQKLLCPSFGAFLPPTMEAITNCAT